MLGIAFLTVRAAVGRGFDEADSVALLLVEDAHKTALRYPVVEIFPNQIVYEYSASIPPILGAGKPHTSSYPNPEPPYLL